MWLIRKERFKKRAICAHVWLGDDTLCQMASTGAIKNIKGYRISADRDDHKICQICQIELDKALQDIAFV
jgi:hypothetical protein